MLQFKYTAQNVDGAGSCASDDNPSGSSSSLLKLAWNTDAHWRGQNAKSLRRDPCRVAGSLEAWGGGSLPALHGVLCFEKHCQ